MSVLHKCDASSALTLLVTFLTFFSNFYLNVFTSVRARVCVSVRSWVSSSDGRYPESQLPGPLRRAARLRVEHHPAGRTPDLPQRHRLRARNQPRLHQRLSRDQVSEWVSEWVRWLVWRIIVRTPSRLSAGRQEEHLDCKKFEWWGVGDWLMV